MAKIAARTHDALARVLALYGIEPTALRRIASGRVNAHWKVHAAGRVYALRRYMSPPFWPRLRNRESIAFEHDALRHAVAKGWPVAAPLPGNHRDTLVEDDGRLYALFPFLPGRPAPYRNHRYLRIKGRLLARFHRDMRSFPRVAQPPGSARVWELDAFLAGFSDERLTFNELLRRFAEHHPQSAAVIRRERYQNLRDLSRLGFGDLPAQFGHFDYHHDNLLFSGGELTGLIDFDSAHLDARVADIANSISLDCRDAAADTAIDPDATAAFVSGYVEGSPLSEQEIALIVPLVQSWHILATVGRISMWLAGRDDRSMRSIRRTVEGRFPSLDARRSAIEHAIQRAVDEAAR